MFQYILRKVVYVGLGAASAGVAFYLTQGTQDIAEWTLKGLGTAAGTAAWGAILSNVMGGALSKTSGK